MRKSKLLYALVSLIAAMLLWSYVVGVERPEKDEVISGIPVTFVGEEELSDFSFAIIDGKRQTVSITVRGSIMDIATLNANKESITAKANLAVVNSAGTKRISYEVTLPRGAGVILLDQSPSMLEVTIEKMATRAVDIWFKNEGSVAEDFLTKPPEMNPATLQLSGPQNLVNSVAHAEVVWTRQNVDQTLSLDLEYKLFDVNGVEIQNDEITANHDFVTVTLPVIKTKVVPIVVDIVAGGGATEADIEKEITPSTIEIAGDPSIIDGINSINVGIAKLSDVLGSSGTKVYPITIPDGVENLSGETECELFVRILNLKQTALTVDNITYINEPEGYTVTLITRQIAVTIRGREEDLEAIAENNLRVVADLSNVDTSEGKKSVPVDVYIDGTTSVGIIGSYSINIEITEGVEE